MDKRALLFLPARLGIALLLCAAIALVFMRFTPGAAMFCMDPPAADPGWKWKVPLAWVIIYGVSGFIAVTTASIRPRHRLIPLAVGFVTVLVFAVIRMLQVSHTYPYWNQKEAHWGIPALVVSCILAWIVTMKTSKAA